MVNSLVNCKDHRVMKEWTYRSLICLSAQLVGKARRLLFEMADLHRLTHRNAPCMWYNAFLAHFFVLSKRSDGSSSQLQNTAKHEVWSALIQSEGVDTKAL